MPVEWDDHEIAKEARDHAWNWFALHAAQRMQTFNFFLVAIAFLIAAYGSLLERHGYAAAVVAVVAAGLAVGFNRLDRRCRQMVKAGEKALAPMQAELAELTANPSLKILVSVEKPGKWASSYGRVIDAIQWSICGVSIVAAIFAALDVAGSIAAGGPG
jgi:hypothetical protein